MNKISFGMNIKKKYGNRIKKVIKTYLKIIRIKNKNSIINNIMKASQIVSYKVEQKKEIKY